MNRTLLRITAALILFGGAAYPQSGTFNFEAGSSQNGKSIWQTVSGVTLTMTSDQTDASVTLQDWSAYPPFVLDAATMNGIQKPSCTFTFSQPVNISSLLVADFYSGRPHLLFTPNTGSSFNGSVDADNGTYFTLNFVQITSFVVTNFDGGNVCIGVDQVVMTAPPTVTFTDGSGFYPAPVQGASNQAIGRFRLAGDVSGAKLISAALRLDDNRTGLSNFKLWQSADAVFGSDSQVGSTVVGDPGNGNFVTFSGFSSSIGTGMTYFLTADLTPAAMGSVRGVVAGNGNLALYNGGLSGTITNARLSAEDASLPVGLVSFSARPEGGTIVLDWVTESETNSLGFILERSADGSLWTTIASYRTHPALAGRGGASGRAAYSFVDENVEPGARVAYRLSEVDCDGRVTVHDPITVQSERLPGSTAMENAYPNPFNPRTYIAYRLAENADVSIRVFDVTGRDIRELIRGRQQAGSYHVYWNGTDGSGDAVPNGCYVIRMDAGEFSRNQKVLFVK